MRVQKHTTPLLSALAASMLFASLLAAVSAHGVYQRYDTDGWGQPVISVLMQALAHRGEAESPNPPDGGPEGSSLLAEGQTNTGELPDALSGQPGSIISGSVTSGQQGADTEGSGTAQGNGSAGPGARAFGGQQGTDPAAPDGSGTPQGKSPGILDGFGGSQSADSGKPGGQQGAGSAVSGKQQGIGSGNLPDVGPESPNGSGASQTMNPAAPNGSDASQSPNPAAPGGSGPDSAQDSGEPRQYSFTAVTQEYFDDALLIGDSRANGVALYSGWTNLTYYTESGMTIYNMFKSKSATVDGRNLSIEEALQTQSFGKIYLEIGINEMGTGTVDSFMEAYTDAVNHLRELQPDAILYVCGIMYVKQSKSESDPIFNNPNIQERNDRIAQLADGEHIFYLDINEIVTDDTGNLNPDYTWDEVHLLGKYDSLWLDYFCSHGIVKEEN